MEYLPINKRNQYITYIYDNVNELPVTHRREVLQMVIYSNIDEKKITEKGNGTQIKFDDMSDELITNIYNFLHVKIENAMNII